MLGIGPRKPCHISETVRVKTNLLEDTSTGTFMRNAMENQLPFWPIVHFEYL
jgi:hypothetical protein